MFRDLKLKKSYSSSSDNLLEDFYIPVLKEAISYKRTTAYFNSYSILRASRGLAYFYSNGGKCQMISGLQLSQEDYNAIKDGVFRIEELLEKSFNLDAFETFNEIQKDHFRFLSWLISTKRLVIKIAAVADRTNSIYHEKMGILTDVDGNEVSFLGSVNETPSGWANNIEQFKVFKSWVGEEVEFIRDDREKFSEYWDSKSSRVLIFDLPEALERKIFEIIPRDFDPDKVIDRIKENELMSESKEPFEIINSPTEPLPLRPYQEDAVSAWMSAGCNGIFAMATGSGKTLTALGAAAKVSEKDDLLLVIGVPYGHLVTQWLEDIERQLSEFKIIKVYSKNANWRRELREALSNFEEGFVKKIVVIGTYASISSESFIDIMELVKVSPDKKKMIIADEMHNFGAQDAQSGMLELYNLRLGLSATPKRYFDEEGTDLLFRYFGDIVYEYDLRRAIENEQLTPYLYHPIFVYLDDEELEKYQEITMKMRKFFSKDSDDKSAIFFNLAIKRARILKKAKNKNQALDDILASLKLGGEINHLLVYCEDMDQLGEAQKVVDGYHLLSHKFTGSEGLDERKDILERFDDKGYNALLAIKCLDEGVNVPSTQAAVIMASSGNSREYIQRKGRVLRLSPKTGKTHADIFDLIVLPPDTSDPLARKIVENEFIRVKDFAECANNYSEIIDGLFDVMRKYGVYF